MSEQPPVAPEEDDEQSRAELLESVAPEIEAAEAAGEKVLAGEAKVTLTIHVANAWTAAEAVQRAINAIIRNGTDAFYFQVTDLQTGDQHLVREGRALSREEVLDLYGDEVPAGS